MKKLSIEQTVGKVGETVELYSDLECPQLFFSGERLSLGLEIYCILDDGAEGQHFYFSRDNYSPIGISDRRRLH